MQELVPLLGIVTALLVGVVSPGPSFVMIARLAVASSRSAGLAAAAGMGAGGVVFAMAALLGLHGLLFAVPSAYVALEIAGGAYLVWLGVRIWASARKPLGIASGAAAGTRGCRSLALGFTTQISNPKTALVYASVFAAFLPVVRTPEFDVALLALVFSVEAGWYAVVALALSTAGPRKAYLRCKAWTDRIAGGVMVALGLRLVGSARIA